MAFFSGSTGVIYRQFSVTIISSMILSVIVALTLTPALCATILKPHKQEENPKGLANWFGNVFDNLTFKYKNSLNKILQTPIRWMIFYAGLISILAFVFVKLPTSFLPKEDQGSIMVQYTLPEGAVTSRTVEVANIIKEYFLNEEVKNITNVFTISGFSSRSSGQNVGSAYISLKNWDLRKGEENRADIIGQRAVKNFSNPKSPYFIRDAKVVSTNPPVVQGLGSTDGFEFQLQADATTSRTTLNEIKEKILEDAGKNEKINSIRADGTNSTPQLKIEYDIQKALSLGLNMSSIDNTLSAAWGGIYVNDFIDRSRVKRVYIQGDASFRSKPEDLYSWKVRNSSGDMVSFSEFANIKWDFGPEELTRYNGFSSYGIQGTAAQGTSSGVAMDEMDKIANNYSSGTMHEWSGVSYQERLSSGQAIWLYTISILIIFLCLAALYESWSVPFSVLMVVPLGVIGAVMAVYFRGLDNDVYFQVALLTTIGLVSKNAILIIEFVDTAFKNGKPLISSAITGATLRLRPIIMTSLAFMAGIMPLALSSGAGANSRISIGTGIVGGTLSATILAIFFVPLFYVLIKKIKGAN
jgi:multidrug efflux pump